MPARGCDLQHRWRRFGFTVVLVCLTILLVSGARMPARSFVTPDNVRIDTSPPERIRSLWMLSGQAQNDLETRFEAESENDLFATYFTRVCLAPIPKTVPGDLQRQSKMWAGRWKRAFSSEVQREKQMAGFVQSAKLAAPLIPVSDYP